MGGRLGTKEAETLRTGVELVDLDKMEKRKEKRFVTVVRTVGDKTSDGSEAFIERWTRQICRHAQHVTERP